MSRSGVKTKMNFLCLYKSGISGTVSILYLVPTITLLKSSSTCEIKALLGTKKAIF